jgi:hypothetical protein
MNTNQGIFESLPGQKSERKDSPFSVAGEPAVQSPFTALEKPVSPFSVAADAGDSKAVKLPEKRKTDSPFQVAEPPEGFGFEAPASAASPFTTQPATSTLPPVSAPAEPAASPFSAPPQFSPPASSPFGVATPAATTPAAAIPSAFTSASRPAADPVDFLAESTSIRQLELRAIFGVDRELSADEIMQRARALSGIRNLARVGAKELATIEGLKNLLPGLGFGSGPLRLYAGNVPIDFIREGSVVLAVQTDGSFAPGVRETLMIVARELGRLG